MIDVTRMEWESIIKDGVNLIINRDFDSLVRLGFNVATQIATQLPPPPTVVALETVDENFLQQLKDSIPEGKDKIRFTSEGGFVIE